MRVNLPLAAFAALPFVFAVPTVNSLLRHDGASPKLPSKCSTNGENGNPLCPNGYYCETNIDGITDDGTCMISKTIANSPSFKRSFEGVSTATSQGTSFKIPYGRQVKANGGYVKFPAGQMCSYSTVGEAFTGFCVPTDPLPVLRRDSSDPYACTQNSDCAIQSMTNCCGTVEVCAKRNAIFPVLDCADEFSTCGGIVPDACECQTGRCVDPSSPILKVLPIEPKVAKEESSSLAPKDDPAFNCVHDSNCAFADIVLCCSGAPNTEQICARTGSVFDVPNCSGTTSTCGTPKTGGKCGCSSRGMCTSS